MYCNVLVIKPFNQYFTYKIEEHQKIKVGHIVQVPFGNKSDLIGLVYEITNTIPKNIKEKQIKSIKFIYENIIINEKLIKFIDWIADYTLAPK